MDQFELKREQLRLARRVMLKDNFHRIKTVGGADCVTFDNKILACVVVCEYPSLKLLEKKTYLLSDPLTYKPGYLAYREMPAIIDAYNQLEQEPDLLIVSGTGVLHSRRLGMASHLGLALNVPTIGVVDKLPLGTVEQGNVLVKKEILGFEIKTREHANPIYVSPGHLVSLGSTLKTIPGTIVHPHKLPEPLHLAHKLAKKKIKKLREEE